MKVRTAKNTKIHVTDSVIHFGGTAVRSQKNIWSKASRQTKKQIRGMNVFAEPEEQDPEEPEVQYTESDLSSQLPQDARRIYRSLSKREQKKFAREYEKELSKRQWTRYGESHAEAKKLRGISAQKEEAAQMWTDLGNNKTKKQKRSSPWNRNSSQPVFSSSGKVGRNAGRTAAKTTADTSKAAMENAVRTAKHAAETGTKAGVHAASGAATLGTANVVLAGVDTAKAAANAAKKISRKLQEQVGQCVGENETIKKQAEQASIAEEVSATKSVGVAAAVSFFALFGMVVLVVTSGIAVLISSVFFAFAAEKKKAPVTQLVEAAQQELEVSSYNIGGYKYKNWYGMDDNWCAMFVSYCADQCGFLDKGIMPKTASVAVSKQWYIDKEEYHSADSGYIPKAGDVIIFGNGMSHTGIVTDYDEETKTITTIEGNTGHSDTTPYHAGSQVKEEKYPLTYKMIDGYGTPDFGASSETHPSDGGGTHGGGGHGF